MSSLQPPARPHKAKLGSSKSLDPKSKAALAAFARDLVEREFNGNTLAASVKLGVSQAALYDVQQGRGGGPKIMLALATYANVPLDEVIGRTPPK